MPGVAHWGWPALLTICPLSVIIPVMDEANEFRYVCRKCGQRYLLGLPPALARKEEKQRIKLEMTATDERVGTCPECSNYQFELPNLE